jgi:hypothetical protein
MWSRKQLGELCAKFVSLTKRQMRAASLNRIVMVCASASMLLAVTAATGKAVELKAAKSQDVVRLISGGGTMLDDLADEAVSENVLWNFGGGLTVRTSQPACRR